MKISSKFNLIAMILISLALLMVSYTSFTLAKQSLKLARLEQLTSITDLKVEEIRAFIFEKKADIKVMQDYFNIKTNLPIMSQYKKNRSDPMYKRAKKKLDDQLRVFYKTYRYGGMMLLGKEGQVVYTANPAGLEREIGRPLPDPGNKAFEEGRKHIYVSEVFQGENKRYKFFVSAPIYDFQKKFAGVTVFEVELASSFFFVQNTIGLGQTGETLIGKKIDNTLHFLNTLRHEPLAKAPGELDPIEVAYPMRQALEGKEGHGISIDYRGEEVLAVWKFIPELKVGLVSKIDTAEAYAYITQLRQNVFLLGVAFFLITLLISTWLSKSLSRPLVKLANFSRKVGSGGLSHRITVDSKDEVGELATSFNDMVQALSEAQETEVSKALRLSETQKNLLNASKEKYQELVETTPYGIQEMDIEGTILFGSQAYHEMLGYEKGSLVGRNIRALLPNGKFEQAKAFMASHRSGQPEPGVYTEQQIKKDGTIIDLEIAWNYKRNSAGKVLGFISVLTDITEKKRTEAILHDQRERIRVIYEQSNDAIFLVDLENDRIVESNAMASSLLGYSAQELSHLPMSTIHPHEMDALRVFNQSLPEHKGGFTREFSCLTKGNKKIPVEISASRILIKGKTYLLALARDITEQKRSKAGRENLITDLETKNAEMERFTYTVSHDLKSPLITIGGYLHLVEKALSEGKMETVESDLYRIASAVATMEHLLKDLLSVAGIGYASNSPQTLPLTQVAEEALALVKGLLKDKNIQVKIAPNLPLATGDLTRIREIFTNLIENAVKFMGDQRTPLIKIGMRHNPREVIICVTDNGMGIDPRYHENVFGLFNRLDKAIDGTGVGLALVKRIVEFHGGRLWVESEGAGQGSTFCFTLPGQVPLKHKPGDTT